MKNTIYIYIGLFDERSGAVVGCVCLVGVMPANCSTFISNGGRKMTFSEAAFYGMGLVLLFGLVSFVLAYLSKPKNETDHPRSHAH